MKKPQVTTMDTRHLGNLNIVENNIIDCFSELKSHMNEIHNEKDTGEAIIFAVEVLVLVLAKLPPERAVQVLQELSGQVTVIQKDLAEGPPE
jgi:hypothetical protein